MNRIAAVLLVGFLLPLAAACGAHHDSEPASEAATTDELKAYKPIPYVLQYIGTYTGTDPKGEVAKLDLTRSGKYTLTTTDGYVEKGSWRGPSKMGAPLAFTFFTSGFAWKGSITGFAGPLVVDRDNGAETLSSPLPADLESLCTDSGGAWRDDDANPTTGLYCDCPKSAPAWIPAKGGCGH